MSGKSRASTQANLPTLRSDHRKKQNPAFLHITLFYSYLTTLSKNRLPTPWFRGSFFPLGRRNPLKIFSDIHYITYIAMNSKA
jgi:hypothetical protein